MDRTAALPATAVALAALLGPVASAQNETGPALWLADNPLQLYLVVLLAAFLPPLVYVVVIRNVERLNREPWSAILRAFFYGAIFSILIAILLEVLFLTNFRREYQLVGLDFTLTQEIMVAVIAAPLAEEFTKGLAVRGARRHIFEIEDGIVYGATAGLGFSATETVIYELALIHETTTPGSDGVVPGLDYGFLVLVALRSITASFLHATTSGILGYGMGRRYLDRSSIFEVLPYYAAAVFLHAGFNLLAQYVDFFVAMAGLIFLSFFLISWTVNRIRRLDRLGAAVVYR